MKSIIFILLLTAIIPIRAFSEPVNNLKNFCSCKIIASESRDDIIDINQNVESETDYVFLISGEKTNHQSGSDLIIKIKNTMLPPFLQDILRPPNFVSFFRKSS